MRKWKAITIGITIFLAARLGFQAAAAVIICAMVIECGPARLKRIPRRLRQQAALQMLGMLIAGVVSVGLAFSAYRASELPIARLASLASWLAVSAMPLAALFHFVSFPIRPTRMAREIAVRSECRLRPLQKAS